MNPDITTKTIIRTNPPRSLHLVDQLDSSAVDSRGSQGMTKPECQGCSSSLLLREVLRKQAKDILEQTAFVPRKPPEGLCIFEGKRQCGQRQRRHRSPSASQILRSRASKPDRKPLRVAKRSSKGRSDKGTRLCSED